MNHKIFLAILVLLALFVFDSSASGESRRFL